jgi:ribosomal protein S27E
MMNPYFLASIFASIKDLKRVCPKCKKAQMVPSNMKDKPVRCKFCGADIPPEKKAK